MSELADPPLLTLALDPGECDALRVVLVDALAALNDMHGVPGAQGEGKHCNGTDRMPNAKARRALLNVSARLVAAANASEADGPAFRMTLFGCERAALADAIDAWMASCNDRRGEPGARERALRRYRAGGVALRL